MAFLLFVLLVPIKCGFCWYTMDSTIDLNVATSFIRNLTDSGCGSFCNGYSYHFEYKPINYPCYNPRITIRYCSIYEEYTALIEDSLTHKVIASCTGNWETKSCYKCLEDYYFSIEVLNVTIFTELIIIQTIQARSQYAVILTCDPPITPTLSPTAMPSLSPITATPSNNPTIYPTVAPTLNPTIDPIINPTINPTIAPTLNPTIDPIVNPTINPTNYPSINSSTVTGVIIKNEISTKVVKTDENKTSTKGLSRLDVSLMIIIAVLILVILVLVYNQYRSKKMSSTVNQINIQPQTNKEITVELINE